MAQPFDAYHKWLGIPKEDQPANHYRLLGIQLFESDPDVIESAADQRMAHVRGYQAGRYAELSQRLLNEIAAARVCLLNPSRRAAYDEELRRLLSAESQTESQAASATSEMPSGIFPAADEVLSPRKARQQAAIRAAKRKQQIPIGPILGIAAAVVFVFVLIMVLNTASKQSPPPTTSSGEPAPLPTPPPEKKSRPAPKTQPSPKKVEPPKSTAKPKQKPKAAEPARDVAAESSPQPDNADKQQGKTKAEPDVPQTGVVGDVVAAAEKQLGSSSATLSVEKPSRVAAPSAESQEAAIEQARDLFKDDLDRAKTPETRQALANTLLDQAERKAGNDPAATFALLRLACDVSTQATDGMAAFRAIDLLAERFEIDPAPMKAEVLAELSTKARTPVQHASIAEQAADLMEEAIAAGNFTLADQFAKLAASASSKGHDKMVASRVHDCILEIRVAQKLTADFEAAQAKLADQPDNPDANATAALYYCFLLGDWEKGLPFLAKGNDAATKALAGRELDQSPRDPAGRVSLADAWWDLAQKSSGKRKEKMLVHAGAWYMKAQPAVTDSLIQAKIEKRLDEIERLDRKMHGGPEPEF